LSKFQIQGIFYSIWKNQKHIEGLNLSGHNTNEQKEPFSLPCCYKSKWDYKSTYYPSAHNV